MAKFDNTLGIEVFKEVHGRAPRPTEALIIRQHTMAIMALAPTEDIESLWQQYVADTRPVDWDEFSLMGCLDGGQ